MPLGELECCAMKEISTVEQGKLSIWSHEERMTLQQVKWLGEIAGCMMLLSDIT